MFLRDAEEKKDRGVPRSVISDAHPSTARLRRYRLTGVLVTVTNSAPTMDAGSGE